MLVLYFTNLFQECPSQSSKSIAPLCHEMVPLNANVEWFRATPIVPVVQALEWSGSLGRMLSLYQVWHYLG